MEAQDFIDEPNLKNNIDLIFNILKLPQKKMKENIPKCICFADIVIKQSYKKRHIWLHGASNLGKSH